LIDTVTDREIIKAYKLLSQNEGVFVEPASAASIAGLFKLKDRNFFSKIKRRKSLKDKKIRVVCILTGHGLKDPEIAIKNIRVPKSVAADREKIVKILKLDKR
jgi:threonine synthase